MKKYRVVKGYEGYILFEVERFDDFIKAKECFEEIKNYSTGTLRKSFLITQIRCFYDDDYLEEEIICSHRQRDVNIKKKREWKK